MDLTVDSGTKGRWPILKVIQKFEPRRLKFHVWLINPWMVHIEMREVDGAGGLITTRLVYGRGPSRRTPWVAATARSV